MQKAPVLDGGLSVFCNYGRMLGNGSGNAFFVTSRSGSVTALVRSVTAGTSGGRVTGGVLIGGTVTPGRTGIRGVTGMDGTVTLGGTTGAGRTGSCGNGCGCSGAGGGSCGTGACWNGSCGVIGWAGMFSGAFFVTLGGLDTLWVLVIELDWVGLGVGRSEIRSDSRSLGGVFSVAVGGFTPGCVSFDLGISGSTMKIPKATTRARVDTNATTAITIAGGSFLGWRCNAMVRPFCWFHHGTTLADALYGVDYLEDSLGVGDSHGP